MIIGPRDHSPQRSASPLVLCRTSKAARIFKFSNIFENSKSRIFLNITAQVSSLKISWCCRVQLKSQKGTQPKFTPSLLHTYLRQDVEGASQPQRLGNHLNAIAHQPCFFVVTRRLMIYFFLYCDWGLKQSLHFTLCFVYFINLDTTKHVACTMISPTEMHVCTILPPASW